MLKQFYNYLSKNTVSITDLGSALTDKNEEEALKLISRGKDAIANCVVGNYPMLKACFLQSMYSCAAGLLKYGANPNQECEHQDGFTKMLQAEINYKHHSNVKILILYGASLEKIDFEKATEELKTLIITSAERFTKIKKLQGSVMVNVDTEIKKNLLELQAEIWQEAAKDEPIDAYRTHYEEKVIDCFRVISKICNEEMLNNRPEKRKNSDNENTLLLPKLKTR